MRVYDLKDAGGRVFAFEVSNFMLGRRGVRRVVRRIPNARVLSFRGRAEEFCEFEVEGTKFVAWEPWNDNSLYWIGPKPPEPTPHLSKVREAFERARPVFGFLLPVTR